LIFPLQRQQLEGKKRIAQLIKMTTTFDIGVFLFFYHKA